MQEGENTNSLIRKKLSRKFIITLVSDLELYKGRTPLMVMNKYLFVTFKFNNPFSTI